jgi:hypothetical protein
MLETQDKLYFQFEVLFKDYTQFFGLLQICNFGLVIFLLGNANLGQ